MSLWPLCGENEGRPVGSHCPGPEERTVACGDGKKWGDSGPIEEKGPLVVYGNGEGFYTRDSSDMNLWSQRAINNVLSL